ncbi:MerR family transcriptional regulator [Streptomyces sp. NBC_01013]|uniref:MerR family transcriptional regulator n=1 Tax=Streptomyces sp. NBC_01013 TaxID=2903718 RepID=UPI00386EFB9B|nr:MerR family transcriptional regulator [Streptomyces sp. NBC_01013]
MAWSIAEVARMSGVTSRTLRHYDEIGLLPPAGFGSNGHRSYDEAGLLRLQRILLMRELGLGLREIRRVLDERTDPVSALREHRTRLREERDRLDTLVRTVERTITELEEGKDANHMMKINRPENLFEGLQHTAEEDAEVRERWPEAWEEARRSREAMTDADQEAWQREATAQMVRLAELMVAGTPADDPAVQSEMEAHYQGVCRFWTPNAEAYRGLGRTYVDDPRMRENFDRIAVGLAAYQRDAMVVYAEARLG